MNSQVRNTLTVLTLSSALVLGLLVVAPAAYPVAEVAATQSGIVAEAGAPRIGEPAAIATLTAEAPVVAGLAASFQHTATTSTTAKPIRRKSGKTNRIRQSMAMPFFSFAPRG